MKTNNKNISSAFTLIELLVVVAVIAILATAVMLTYPNSQKKARDAQRQSDLSQYRTSVESFANANNGIYPSYNVVTTINSSNLCSKLGLSACAMDPRTGTGSYDYKYLTDGTGAGSTSATKYVIYDMMEATGKYFGLCSSGTSLSQTSAPTLANCP